MGTFWGFLFPGTVIRLRCLVGSSRRTAGRNFRLLKGFRLLLFDNLGSLPSYGEPLAVLAALITLTLQMPLMTFFPGILSVFLAYLYNWYCFLAFFSLKSEMQLIPLEVFYSGLGYT